jgi:cathepsin B
MKMFGIFLLTFLSAYSLRSYNEAWTNANSTATTWTTCEYNKCKFTNLLEFKSNLIPAANIEPTYILRRNSEIQPTVGDLPEQFDPRKTEMAKCIHPIRDQGDCGSCWAFAISEVFSDRLCIYKNEDMILSPQDLVSCDTLIDKGCNGGTPQIAWEYTAFSGLVSENCFPYTSGWTGESGECKIKSKQCTNTSVTFEKRKTSQPKLLMTQNDIKAALITGPVVATMYVYDDFELYEKGIYIRTHESNFLGGHAIKMIGYGVDLKTSINYWICANSWSDDWGEDGFFRIKMGEVMIDSACSYANPK